MNIKRGIEYYYNGPEAETLRASFKQMKRAAERMRAGEHVLYINALTSPREVEAVAESVSNRHRGKVLTYSVTSTSLAARLQFITLTCAAKKVRTIILNSIDFAARTTNQKKALVHFLREMRDVHECRVIVYGIHAPTDDGAVGQLKYVTERALRYDQWNAKETPANALLILDDEPLVAADPSDAANSFIAVIEEELPVIEAETSDDGEFVDEEGIVTSSRHVDFSVTSPLKINDLTGAQALRAMKNSKFKIKNGGRVEELEYALVSFRA